MTQSLLNLALAEFAPPLKEAEKEAAGQELIFLARLYRARVEERLPGAPPFRRMIRCPDGTHRPETEEERAVFFVEWKNRPRPGRPFNFAAWMLVYELRDMLHDLGCHFGATKDAKDGICRLARMASAVHRLSGVDATEPNWQDIAEQSADEVTKIVHLLGEGLDLPPRSDPEARAAKISLMRMVLEDSRVPEPQVPKRTGKRESRHRAKK